jgi:UDP-3-O-[3-hydroxymyristoyl] N-acetylglucosamine deacetylase / 3-hydroxyacyl-[acyl-carrier-protein] dehydratase
MTEPMHTKQHTIQKAVTVSGVGLHTGAIVNMTFKPAPIDFGIKYQRIDLENKPIIEADCDLVVDCSRGTTIEKNGARVSTIEHGLAALVGLQIDNVLIEIDGPETPIMDGSALPFIQALESVGLAEQNALRNYFEIPHGITFIDEEKNIDLVILPLNDYRVSVMVDYNSPVLGTQYSSLNNINQFVKEIAPCRTFVFLHELEMLFKANLIKGGDINNAIVIVDRLVKDDELNYLAGLFNKEKIEVKKEGILNNIDLRFPNEMARHKLLDVMGDLALVGRPIKGQVLAARPGHASNVALAKKIKKAMLEAGRNQSPKYDPSLPPVMDVNKIYSLLPHTYPFKLVDKIIHLNENTVVSVKNVTINEPFFQGHFPGNPVMPGVLQIEAMAQTGGILAMNTVEDPENYWTYFLSIDNAKFRKMVTPGDTLIFKCEIKEPIKRGIMKMTGQAYVAGNLVCEATLTAAIVRKDK